ncbi:hypothetical protein Hypma_006638 [Hypsizygus marmoreus]|uniref:Uncharacterized protein n=1 Tax=Hypsizygus marmoreus TaxID=39966 RepID=A0A369K122_HYPMA|nr:hypothetical protein Hypma_006638 [Hypsizygus marmoreus]
MTLARFQLPGFGLPLNFVLHAESADAPATGEGRDLFKNALNTNDIAPGAVHVASSSHFDSVKRLPLVTLREITMLHLMNKLTDKPDWNKKVFDDVIASKWKSEALATEALDITQSMVDWCIDEVRYKAKLFEETGAVSVYNGDVVKSDTVIPSSLKEALRKAVAPLEQVPARQQDWHPGSDEKVLDLVIVKLASIHLTPEKPEYGGGTWHVDGQLNEHICATATYYYDTENITSSRLAFRQQCKFDANAEIRFLEGSESRTEAVPGRDAYDACVQDHRVQPFKLADPTKPGHHKILTLFLVDPGIRIISTANVPCQQKEWWSDDIRSGSVNCGDAISALPVELQEQVFGDVEDFPIGLKEAKELREMLMEERKKYVVEHDKAFHQYPLHPFLFYEQQLYEQH